MTNGGSERDRWNGARWQPGTGHHESWFVRANHPSRPLALWIRYTIFAPSADPDAAVGELWAVWSDGIRHRITVARSEHPAADCRFDRERLDVDVAGARLTDAGLSGRSTGAGRVVTWSLSLAAGGPPLLLLPAASYERRFPMAKAVVARPGCVVSGEISVDGEPIAIDGWTGSQNHNWGPAHTDRYAWGQVTGFAATRTSSSSVPAPASGPGRCCSRGSRRPCCGFPARSSHSTRLDGRRSPGHR